MAVTVPTLDGIIEESERKIISVRRDNIIFMLVLEEGRMLIEKNYFPDLDYPDVYSRFFPDNNGPFMGASHQYPVRSSEHYINKESVIMAVSNELTESFAPQIQGVKRSGNPRARSIIMEYIPGGNYKDMLLEGGDKRKAVNEMIDKLVELHSIFGNNLSELYHKIRWGRRGTQGLKPRNFQQEIERWTHYFKTIIYYGSSRFSDYLQKNTRLRKKGNSQETKFAKNAVDNFTYEIKLELAKHIHDFLYNDWLLVYDSPPDKMRSLVHHPEQHYSRGYATIIHGDFYPQNIFASPRVKVCDFPEMRVANRHIDISSLLYNIYTLPRGPGEEMDAIESIMGYLEGINKREQIKRISFPDFLAGCFETRLKEFYVRLFALDYKFNNEEVKKYIAGLPQFENVEEGELKEKFLKEMFIDSFKRFSSYVRNEGKNYLQQSGKSQLFYQNLEIVENFFCKIGVIEKTDEQKRQERFTNLLERAVR